MGQHHAFTRYHAAEYDFETKRPLKTFTESAGNIVWRKIGDKAFQICLHYPWQTTAGPRTYDLPLDGVVDAVMKGPPVSRLGFDVAGSPFGRSATTAFPQPAASGSRLSISRRIHLRSPSANRLLCGPIHRGRQQRPSPICPAHRQAEDGPGPFSKR
jgi:hypothetical protein